MSELFNFGVSLSVAAAPPSVRDEITDRVLASFAKCRERSKSEVEDEMLQNFDATEANAINGSRT